MTYNALAPSEQATALPSGQATPLALPGLALQPPLSRRGTGPGIIVVLPPKLSLRPHAKLGLRPPLDPDPVLKWAEEGFNVVGAQLGANTDVSEALAVALAALEECPSVDAVGKYGVLGECPLCI
jgi:carboxymethylenebutenolidase